MTLASRFRPLACLLLLSAVGDAQEIHVDPDEQGLIVRSAISEANFLFRAGPGFEKTEPEKPFLVALRREIEGGAATVRLRISPVTGDELRGGMERVIKAREARYRGGAEGELKVSGEGARRRITVGDARTVVVVADGDRLYELFLDGPPAELAAIGDGFTILDPKGAPVPQPIRAEDLKPQTIEHDYYRLEVFKPAGFTRQEVDPNSDPGIFLHLRRHDEQGNLCEARIRVHLAKAVKKSLETIAQERIDGFRKRYTDARGPAKPKRGSWSGAKNAYRFKLVGKGRHGLVVEEEWRVFEHKNGRLYEMQMTLWGGAARAFRKDISAFWRKLKVRGS